MSRREAERDTALVAFRPLEQAAFMRSQLAYRGDYSTLMDTVASAFASSTLWIS
jgi:hypothetical protein